MGGSVVVHNIIGLDGSSLTVGSNSDVVVDRFIYAPDARTGKLVFSATKGVFRLMGGGVSKTKPVTKTLTKIDRIEVGCTP